jgi:thiamine kinase-like enzyme
VGVVRQELLSKRLHAPAVRVALADLERDIRRSLSDWLPSPAGTPDHWVPIHGDLTPWNLRRTTYSRGSDSRPFLIDWESTRWGPPGADTVYLWLSSAASDIRASARAARRQVLELSPDNREESRAFWFEIISARSRDDEDGDVSRRMLELLELPAAS